MQAEQILEALKKVQRSGISITTETLADYGLDNVDCSKCGNTGVLITKKEDGTIYARECDCMAKRRSLRKIKNSGLADMMLRYSFESYETPDESRRKNKAKALAFCEDTSAWFYIAGRSGSGKTHLCTAICAELIDKGTEVYYMSWRDESTALKSAITDSEAYESRIRKLKTVEVLYIDDFLKGGDTDADVRLAFEILNARYNDKKLRTIISSERDITELLDRDEALGGRIYERAKGYILLSATENWRLR